MPILSNCPLTLFRGQKKKRKTQCPWRNCNRPLTEYFFLWVKRPKHTEDHPTTHLHLSPALRMRGGKPLLSRMVDSAHIDNYKLTVTNSIQTDSLSFCFILIHAPCFLIILYCDQQIHN